MIKLNFYLQSKNWSRRMSKVTKITNEVVKKKTDLNFDKNINYYLNIILLNDKKMKKLNLKYKRKNITTDVLTFVSTPNNINYNNLPMDFFYHLKTFLIEVQMRSSHSVGLNATNLSIQRIPINIYSQLADIHIISYLLIY